MRAVVVAALLLFQASPVFTADDICFVGYIMDTYCIRRGRLLDNPDQRTLASQGPIVHTVHCIVDEAICSESGFEVLAPNPNGDGFCRAYKLDDAGNQKVIDLARNTGVCSTCSNGNAGPGIKAGFNATVVGRVTASGPPASLQVTQVLPHNASKSSLPAQCRSAAPKLLECDDGQNQIAQAAHGTLACAPACVGRYRHMHAHACTGDRYNYDVV